MKTSFLIFTIVAVFLLGIAAESHARLFRRGGDGCRSGGCRVKLLHRHRGHRKSRCATRGCATVSVSGGAKRAAGNKAKAADIQVKVNVVAPVPG